ncbi:hypothetical protein ACOAKC_09325 [Hathewaya histolytica]|uniref:hypothetical protein n=1 Tax=Hathewaya histolytica TaxID=1498 RepID=UPI003B679134
MSNKLSQCIKENVLNLINEYTKEFYEFDVNDGYISENCYLLIFEGQITEDSLTKLKMLVININEEYKQIQIPNIYMPETMKYKNIGKALISKIFNIAKQNDYELFIVDMVPSFYQKLINRGALPCTEEDAVEITEDTRLI